MRLVQRLRINAERSTRSAGDLVQILAIAGLLVSAIFQAAPAVAQSVARAFDVPLQSLAGAISAFGRQSGFQVSIAADLARGRRSQPVSGQFSPEQALGQMLAGTGLSFRVSGARTLTVYDPSAQAQATVGPGGINLDTIDVSGKNTGFYATRSSSGSKTDTPLIEIPQSISVVTRQQLDTRNVQRDREALLYSPGIYAEPYGGEQRYDSFFLRGFDGYNGKFRDGMRLQQGIWAQFRTDPYGLERIDFVRGPASILYGQTNPGGIVDTITKRPPENRLREIQLQIGNYDRYQGAFDFGGAVPNNDHLRYRLTGMVRKSDTQYKYNDSNAIPDDRQYFAPAITIRPSADTTLTIQSDYLYNKTAAPFTMALPGPVPTKTLYGEPDYNKYEYTQYTSGYWLEHHFNNAVTFRQNFRTGLQNFTYANLGGTLAGNGRTINRTSSIIFEQLTGTTVDNQLQMKLATGIIKHTVLFGFDYRNSFYDSITRSGAAPSIDVYNPVYGAPIVTPTTVSSSSEQLAQQTGIYFQDQMKIAEQWVLTLGGRQDWAGSGTQNRRTNVLTTMNDQAFTYRAGLTYLFENGLAPYVAYSESFFPTSGTDISGQPFKPTTGNQYEGGIKYQPKWINAIFTAAVFELTQQNVTTPDPLNVSYRVQTGEMRSRGLELEATTTPIEGLNVLASFTYLDTKVTKSNTTDLGKRPILVPEYTASLWADYTFKSGVLSGFGLGGGARYVGPTYFDTINTLQNPGYTIADAVLRYDLGAARPQLKGWHTQVNINNLFDKDYATCWNTSACTWGLRRTVIGTMKYNW